MVGFWDGSGISWTACKRSAPRSRQITAPTPHHSIFTDRMFFLTPNKQCQSTEGTYCCQYIYLFQFVKLVKFTTILLPVSSFESVNIIIIRPHRYQLLASIMHKRLNRSRRHLACGHTQTGLRNRVVDGAGIPGGKKHFCASM